MSQNLAPYWQLLKDSVRLGFTDSQIALGYLGGFVARASTVAISLFIPLFVNTFFIGNGYCKGSPNDPSPELKKECEAAYKLAAMLTGVAQLMGLICAPIFGYLSRKQGRVNWPVVVATVFGILGYVIFPQLSSPEPKDVDGRGGTPVVFLIATLIGISQIGAIVCSLGSLGKGVLTADLPTVVILGATQANGANAADGESEPLLEQPTDKATVSRVRLKGSIAGVYSWCGGAAILLLTKLGGYLFDVWTTGAPFYMMAIFNGALLFASLGIDCAKWYQGRRSHY
jgi:MFS family permease